MEELVFVGDQGRVKSKGQQALREAGLRHISALTDAQIRRLLGEGTLQMGMFSEAEAQAVRYLLRKNQAEAARRQHRLEDRLARLTGKLEPCNELVSRSPCSRSEARLRNLQLWVARHKLTGPVEQRSEGRRMALQRNQAVIERSIQPAGCSVVATDVPKQQLSRQQGDDRYVSLHKLERDFRQLKAGLLEVRPAFVRKHSGTGRQAFCCPPALKLARETERRLQAVSGTTDANPQAITRPDALASLSRLCLLESGR